MAYLLSSSVVINQVLIILSQKIYQAYTGIINAYMFLLSHVNEMWMRVDKMKVLILQHRAVLLFPQIHSPNSNR